MAEDKKIRISADLSQLRSLRDEAESLRRELNQLSTSTEKTDESIAKLKEQLALLGERNDLEELYGELRKKNAEIPNPELPTTIDKPHEPTKTPISTTDTPSSHVEREIIQDEDKKKRPPLTIIEGDPQVPEEKDKIEDTPGSIEREIADKPTPPPQLKDITPKVDSPAHPDLPKPQKPKQSVDDSLSIDEEPVSTTIDRPQVKRKKSFIDRVSDFVDDIFDAGDSDDQFIDRSKRSPISDSPGNKLADDRSDGVDLLAFLEKWKDSLSQTDAQRNEILTEASEYLEGLNKTVNSILGRLPDSTVPPVGGSGPPQAPVNPEGEDESGDEDESGKTSVADITKANLLTKVITAGVDKMQEIWQIIVDRHLRTLTIGEQKDYLDPISSVTSYTSYKGAQQADLYRWIPFIGKAAASEIEIMANAEAQKQGIGLRSAAQLEGQVRPYAQTFGVSLGQAESAAFREGGYAAGALGMTAGQYSERRSQLVRAGGGRDFVSGIDESQSLLAAERLYGLSPQAASGLQRSMRFAESDGTSTTSSSAVLRVFEQTMKELKKPFSEIASTIEESLDTFNRSVQDVLSKTGDFDAAKIAGSLAGIRAYTGAEGKQLERYQESFSGQAISQDEVTQALLLRAITRTDSSIKTYSDAMAKIEKIQEEPEIMRGFLKELQSLTTTNEQFINVLSAVFPKLSISDIKEQVEKPGFNIDALFDKIMESVKKTQKESDKKNQYERDAARKTVGTLESANASYQNKMVSYGLTIAGDIAEIRKRLERIEEKPVAKDSIDAAVDYVSDALIKAGASLAPKKGATAKDLSWWTTVPSVLLSGMGMQMKQLFKEEED